MTTLHRRLAVLLMVAATLLLSTATGFAYGFRVHSAVNERAVETLPEEMREGFFTYARLLSKHASDPDL